MSAPQWHRLDKRRMLAEAGSQHVGPIFRPGIGRTTLRIVGAYPPQVTGILQLPIRD